MTPCLLRSWAGFGSCTARLQHFDALQSDSLPCGGVAARSGCVLVYLIHAISARAAQGALTTRRTRPGIVEGAALRVARRT